MVVDVRKIVTVAKTNVMPQQDVIAPPLRVTSITNNKGMHGKVCQTIFVLILNIIAAVVLFFFIMFHIHVLT